MKYINNVIKLLIIIIMLSMILGTLSYFNIINEDTIKMIQIITTFVCIFYNSYHLGKNKQNKGYLEGFKYGGIIILIFSIITLLFKRKIDIYKMIYYILIMLLSICGSILGINKKTKA